MITRASWEIRIYYNSYNENIVAADTISKIYLLLSLLRKINIIARAAWEKRICNHNCYENIVAADTI